MLTDQELIAIQVEALFSHNARGRLLFVNEQESPPAPRLFLGRTRAGNLWRFRADLPEILVEQLKALCAAETVGEDFHKEPRHFAEYMHLLQAHAPVQNIWSGPAYHFTDCPEPSGPLHQITENNTEMLKCGFKELSAESAFQQPFVALVKDNRAVSVCRSIRITPVAHEAGVETLADYRGKGYAKEVVAGWAALVRSAGAIPLYSTSWENASSQSVAKKLNLLMYGSDFHIT